MGNFDRDWAGKIINDKGVDLKKRKVNKAGYLVDNDGNVINNEGTKLFDKNHLTSGGEIPKILPFTKFNIYEVCGDLEKNVDGKPIMNYNKNGDTVDWWGRWVN